MNAVLSAQRDGRSDRGRGARAARSAPLAVTEAALERIAAHTRPSERVHDRDGRTGARRGRGGRTRPWPRAAIRGRSPACRYAVKNLFDLAGVVTARGLEDPSLTIRPPRSDATAVARLRRAGAVCVGALNMGEFAYDFVTENAHDGPTRNPRDLARSAGGSSGGSAPRSPLGSCRFRSVPTPTDRFACRLPSAASWGLKPTYGRLSRAGSFPFVASLDHIGPFARSVADLALVYDAMQGPDAARSGVHDAARRAGDVPRWSRASTACASRSSAATSRPAATPPCTRPSNGWPRRSGATRRRRTPEPSSRHAPPHFSSPRPKAGACTSSVCAREPRISIPAVRDRLHRRRDAARQPGISRRRDSAPGGASRSVDVFRDVDVLLAPGHAGAGHPPGPGNDDDRRPRDCSSGPTSASSPSRSASSACPSWPRRCNAPPGRCRSACS